MLLIGDVIQPDIFSLHYDQELWGPESPHEFIPERHASKRHPIAYMPFGQGPRNCLGMRFALMEIKLCLTHLLHHYTILMSDKTENSFKIRETLVIQPGAVYIRIRKRE